jgi:hypothetical protein
MLIFLKRHLTGALMMCSNHIAAPCFAKVNIIFGSCHIFSKNQSLSLKVSDVPHLLRGGREEEEVSLIDRCGSTN